ncbi:MAG: glycosyltransferase family 9 protein [Rhodanobacteraceae bacterium]
MFHASDARLTPMTCLSDTDVPRILICRPNHRLGNLLLLTPLLTEIQQRFPDADVDIVLAGAHGPELFQTFSNVKHIYCLSRRMVRHPIAVVRTALKIRKAHYDLAIDPCEASQSGRLLVAVAGAKYAIGLPRDRRMVNSMAGAPRHMAQWPVYLLRRALVRQWPESGNDFPALDIRLSSSERERARTILERMTHESMPPTPFVIGVFAEATGAKGYGKEWWQCFVRTVHEQHPDAALVEIAPADGRPRFANEVPFFHSPSPREVAAMISNMTCFVSADCGVMHLASAAGTPTIGLFSVTDASKYAPYAHGSRALDTNVKSPEEVAQEVGVLITTFRFRAGIPVGPCGRSCGDRHDDEGAR